MIRRSAVVALLIGLIPILALAGDPPPKGEFNDAVAKYARAQVGEKVGDGDCTTLVQEALREAGARMLHGPEPDGEYLWGEVIPSVKDAKPGDIVQFEKVVFYGRRRVIGDNGAPAIRISKTTLPHHSAIVSAVGPKGKTLTILHQNAAGPDGQPLKIVQESTLIMSERQKGGTLRIYRPVPREP